MPLLNKKNKLFTSHYSLSSLLNPSKPLSTTPRLPLTDPLILLRSESHLILNSSPQSNLAKQTESAWLSLLSLNLSYIESTFSSSDLSKAKTLLDLNLTKPNKLRIGLSSLSLFSSERYNLRRCST